MFGGHRLLRQEWLPLQVVDLAAGTHEVVAGPLEPRIDPLVVGLPDGSVLFAGGINSEGEWTRSAEVFDPATEEFKPTGPFQTTSVWREAVQLADGRILTVDTLTGKAEIYDPTSGSFVRTGDLTKPRGGARMALLPDGRVLIAGGGIFWSSGKGTPHWIGFRSAEIFDPAGSTADVRKLVLKPRSISVKKNRWFKVTGSVTNQGGGTAHNLTFCTGGNSWIYFRDLHCEKIAALEPGETAARTFKGRLQLAKSRGRIETPVGKSRRIRLTVEGQDVDVSSYIQVRVRGTRTRPGNGNR
jgi:hypothetical protein